MVTKVGLPKVGQLLITPDIMSTKREFEQNDEVRVTGLESGYRITRLNRLAFPKGKIPKCELSGQPATVACITPSITLYYATEEQAEQAWHGKTLGIPSPICSVALEHVSNITTTTYHPWFTQPHHGTMMTKSTCIYGLAESNMLPTC